MARARLTDKEIEMIVGMLASWKGTLTWDKLLDRVRPFLRRSFTRQGLDKNESIKLAYGLAKDRIRTRPKRKGVESDLPPELAYAQQRIDTLTAEVARLETERERFLERFAIWLYNARSRGISEADLNRELPPVDRGASEVKR
ncbi:hypothetical protein ABIA25_001561 [Sinorhizobium fredii]|uniref:hypothetical protein n=1 Tax=Rhizobium fredii TaxID=380 RepID=UPI0035196A2A